MTNDATAESRRIWDGVSAGWDKHRDTIAAFERAVTDHMIDAVGARDGDTILELTAGPGDVGLELAQRRPGAHVLITDFAPGMVEAARRAAKERGIDNVECREIDAQAIDLPDASVGGVLSRYGLMLVPDRARAFAEIRRVLRPGRTLAYAVWGPIETNPWMTVFGAVLAQRGHFQPDPGQVMPLTTEEENSAALAAAGFEAVEVQPIDAEMVHESFDRYWDLSRDIAGPLAAIARDLPAEEKARVRAAVEEFSMPYRDGERLVFPSRRLFVRAV